MKAHTRGKKRPFSPSDGYRERNGIVFFYSLKEEEEEEEELKGRRRVTRVQRREEEEGVEDQEERWGDRGESVIIGSPCFLTYHIFLSFLLLLCTVEQKL